jgi:hypothetical protein|tara:strand:+ start:151 stop:1026 length:876 start_codon:yes stop_codon:yes gene_type:complete
MANIDVICVCGKNALDYARLLKITGDLLVSGKHNINWLAVSTPKFRDIPEGFTKVHDLEPSSSDSGIIHGEGLMAGAAASISEYILFSDVDVGILTKDWDDKLVKKMNEYDIVGFEYGGGFEKVAYQEFPTITFCMLNSAKYKLLNVDLRQGKKLPTLKIKSQRLADIYAHKKGSNLLLETGWRLPFRYKRAGFKGLPMKKIMPSSKKCILKFVKTSSYKRSEERYIARRTGSLDFVQHEFYLDDEIFATHLRRSRKYHFGHRVATIWIEKIRQYIYKSIKKDIQKLITWK